MKMVWTCIAAAGLAFGPAERANAQWLTNQSFNVVLQGDDPGEVYRIDLPGNAQLPGLVRFEGVFENLDPFETGVRYDLSWSLADSVAFDGSEYIDFTRLPASGRLSVAFTKWIWFTPQTMRLLIEGGGPGDHFRFVGQLSVRQVAPSTMANCLPPTGIIGWWPGDLVTNDVIGGRHAVLRGGAGFGPGRVLEAFTLNGNGQFVEVASDADFNRALNSGTNDFTLELWVRFNTADGEQVIAEKYIETMDASTHGWTITKLPNQVIRFALGGGGNVESPAAATITLGAWTHIAARRKGTTFTLFQNGSAGPSGNFEVDLDSISSLKFGHRGNPSDTPGSADTRDFWLNGAIDEPALYRRALSDEEIAAIFQAGAAGKCRRPVIIALAAPQNGPVRATVKGIAGLTHVLQGSSDLINWSPLVTNVPAAEIFELDAVHTGASRRFYRAMEVH